MSLKDRLFEHIKNNSGDWIRPKMVFVSYMPKYDNCNMCGSYKSLSINDLKDRCYTIQENTDSFEVIFLDTVYCIKTHKHEKIDYNLNIPRFIEHNAYLKIEHEIIYPIK
jgi:hypothetical protein